LNNRAALFAIYSAFTGHFNARLGSGRTGFPRPHQVEFHDMRKFFAKFRSDESGATAIEYGLIAALISVAIITAVTAVGTSLTSTFNSVASAL